MRPLDHCTSLKLKFLFIQCLGQIISQLKGILREEVSSNGNGASNINGATAINGANSISGASMSQQPQQQTQPNSNSASPAASSAAAAAASSAAAAASSVAGVVEDAAHLRQMADNVLLLNDFFSAETPRQVSTSHVFCAAVETNLNPLVQKIKERLKMFGYEVSVFI